MPAGRLIIMYTLPGFAMLCHACHTLSYSTNYRILLFMFHRGGRGSLQHSRLQTRVQGKCNFQTQRQQLSSQSLRGHVVSWVVAHLLGTAMAHIRAGQGRAGRRLEAEQHNTVRVQAKTRGGGPYQSFHMDCTVCTACTLACCVASGAQGGC